jgi:arginine/lysine/ornithine decarboxylase
VLFEKLKANNRIPFHMPGHKRNTKLLGNKLPYDIDITEIEGFDNLHNPEGIIKEIENKAKSIYQSENSFILVNGSTVGILAGINSVVKQGDTVLVARNCHKSVYNALEIARAKAEYLEPPVDEYGICGKISLAELEKKIDLYEPKLIVVTSPTYEGVVSNLQQICEIAHFKNIPVLVDAAHGATDLCMIEDSKADIVVMSLHKTLPALTQCAVAHINGNLVDPQKFRIKLSVFETSSPSYVLMSSIDYCLDFLINNPKNSQLNINYHNCLSEFYNDCEKLNNLKVLSYDENSKIIIFTDYTNINGNTLAKLLRDNHNIEIEMATKNYVLAMTSICDDFSNYKKLSKALFKIDETLEKREYIPDKQLHLPYKKLESWQVDCCDFIDFNKSDGCVCGESIWAYPPGIPLIVAGEVVSKDVIAYVKDALDNGVNIQSTYNKLPKEIYCQLT